MFVSIDLLHFPYPISDVTVFCCFLSGVVILIYTNEGIIVPQLKSFSSQTTSRIQIKFCTAEGDSFKFNFSDYLWNIAHKMHKLTSKFINFP